MSPYQKRHQHLTPDNYVLRAPPGPDGKRRRQWSKGFATKKEAEAALTEELRRRDLGIILSAEKLTVCAFADRWWPWWPIVGHAAGASSRRVRWLVRVRSRACPFHQASRRIRLSATAA